MDLMSPDEVIDVLCDDQDLPRRMQALICVLSASPELKARVVPEIDLEKHQVDWDRVMGGSYSPTAQAGLVWARYVWDPDWGGTSPFALVDDMTPAMRRAVVESILISWDVSL